MRMRVLSYRFFPIAVLLLLGIASYWNSFRVPFVFDDLDTIQRNSFVRFGGVEYYSHLRPYLSPRSLLFLTFAFNNWLNGENPFSYHVVNVLLHILNGLLVFALARWVYRVLAPSPPEGYALLAAAFFLCHPVQTESVTYISSRSELLSTLFYLIGFLVFVLWPEGQVGFLCSLAVGIPYLFGLGSKETAVTLPASIFVYDYLLLSGAEFRLMLSRWRFYLTYVLGASAAIHYLLAIGLKGVVGGNAPVTLSSQEYLLTQTRVIIRYIKLVLFPVGLNLDYDFRPSLKLFEPGVLI